MEQIIKNFFVSFVRVDLNSKLLNKIRTTILAQVKYNI